MYHIHIPSSPYHHSFRTFAVQHHWWLLSLTWHSLRWNAVTVKCHRSEGRNVQLLEQPLGGWELGKQKTLNTWFYRWWQLNLFLVSPRKLGKMNPFWRAYFSNGLVQPPTRIVSGGSFCLSSFFHEPFMIDSQSLSSTSFWFTLNLDPTPVENYKLFLRVSFCQSSYGSLQ